MLSCIYPRAMGSLIVKQVNLKCIFYCNTQSYCYRSYLCSKGAGIARSAQWLTAVWMVWGSNAGGGKIFLSQPDQTRGPTSLLYTEYWVCFLKMKWPGCGTDHPTLLVLRSHIQRAIPLLPLCACLACNRTAFTFIHIQIPYTAHNNNQTTASKDICSGP